MGPESAGLLVADMRGVLDRPENRRLPVHRRLSASSSRAGFFTLENFTFASIWQATISSWRAMGVPGTGPHLTWDTKKANA